MTTELVDIRQATISDCEALSEIHSQAWKGAYRGILNGLELQRLITRRTADWWERALNRGVQIKVLDVLGSPAGYATYGTCRMRDLGLEGEIYELYLKPEHQGIGFGRRLFQTVRDELASQNLKGLAVQVLSDNSSACNFYRALGGKLTSKSTYGAAGNPLELSIYGWPEADE